MKAAVLTIVLFWSTFLIAQKEIIYDNSLKPGQRLIQTSTAETNISTSSVFADTIPRDLVELIQNLEQSNSFLSPGGSVEKTSTKIRFVTGEANAKTLAIPGQMEFLEFKVLPDTLETLSLKGLKVYFQENRAKEIIIDSVDLSSMNIDENSEWLKEYYFEMVKSFFPSITPVNQKLKIGEQFTQKIVVPNKFFPGPMTNRQTFTLNEIKDGIGIFKIDMLMELPEDVIKKADPLDPEFEDMLYFAITKFNGRGKGRMIFDSATGIVEQLDMETTTVIELLRFGGSTTTTITTITKTSESTMPEN